MGNSLGDLVRDAVGDQEIVNAPTRVLGPGLGVELREDILETAPYHEWTWNLSYNEYK